jgi:hypothetical protein
MFSKALAVLPASHHRSKNSVRLRCPRVQFPLWHQIAHHQRLRRDARRGCDDARVRGAYAARPNTKHQAIKPLLSNMLHKYGQR